MNPAAPVLVVSRETQTQAQLPFAFSYPTLSEGAALCIGLSIDWQQAEALRAYALQHTVAEERARAERFMRAEDSLRNLLGRALLRQVASHYGGMDPMQSISTNSWGKPQLAQWGIDCNLSHTGTELWVAVTRDYPVGLDIERATAPREFREVSSFFHPDEVAALTSAPDTRTAVMRCWNRKEAVSKATGLGLSLPLRDYAVACDSRSADWLLLAPPPPQHQEWTTADLPIGNDYLGAIAVRGKISRVDVIRLKPDWTD